MPDTAFRCELILGLIDEDIIVVTSDLAAAYHTTNIDGFLGELPPVNAPFLDLLPIAPATVGALRIGLRQCFDPGRRLRVSLSMLPKEVTTRDGKTLELRCKPWVGSGARVEYMVCFFRDITKAHDDARKEQQELEDDRTLLGFLRQRSQFERFLDETAKQLAELHATTSGEDAKRILHTLKGNLALLGLREISHHVHEMESLLVASPADLGLAAQLAQGISRELYDYLKANVAVLQTPAELDASGCLHVDPTKIGSLAGPAEDDDPAATSASFVDETVHQYATTVRKIAERLNKRIHFRAAGTALPLHAERCNSVIPELIHIIRNCCDHGIERPEERVANGKFPEGTISMSLRRVGASDLQIVVEDDGAGIRKDRLLARAVRSGIVAAAKAPTMDEAAIDALIFVDGVSTADYLTPLSGRGVGLSALKGAVEQQGGTIEVHSQPGRGTSFTLTIPGGLRREEADHFFDWDEAYSIHIDEIDKQHAHLVELINRAAGRVRLGDINDILHELARYTEYHFESEERLMRAAGYPETDAHADLHRSLIESVVTLTRKFDNEETLGLSQSLLEFLKTWLLTHILGADQAFGAYYLARQRPAQELAPRPPGP